MFENIKQYHVFLASQSPRRQFLLKELGVDFKVLVKDNIDESFPDTMPKADVALYLAQKKADAYTEYFNNNNLFITADTIVYHDGNIINKPVDRENAIKMLKALSGSSHQVISGVVLSTQYKKVCFDVTTTVFFKELKEREIIYYVDAFKPFDKAGAYGIQEWIGYIGIDKIEGSYFNVMGLPVQRLYSELIQF